MENIIAIGVALGIVFFVVGINKFFGKRSMRKLMYSQSFIHSIIKDSLPKQMPEKERMLSQSLKHAEQNMIKVVVIDGTAYWVKDNIFYTSETNNGNIVQETAKPVDIENMSKEDLDKMLIILDNLGKRKNRDDSSSTGN